MVVDSSAIVAILLRESEAASYAAAIESSEQPLISSASVIEAGIVLLRRYGPAARRDLDEVLEDGGFIVVPVAGQHVDLALDAYERFGRGSGHPARLNYGDCFSYALAKATGRPLLFKGDDFARTDLRSAL